MDRATISWSLEPGRRGFRGQRGGVILCLWCDERVASPSHHTARSRSCPASSLGVSVPSSPAVPDAMDLGREPQYGACRCSRLALCHPADNPEQVVQRPGTGAENRLCLSGGTYFASALSVWAAIDRRRAFDSLHESAPSIALCRG